VIDCRENFFTILRSKSTTSLKPMSVEALGKCGGQPLKPHTARGTNAMMSRGAHNYIDLATESYIPFKFVVAFENSFIDGYITENWSMHTWQVPCLFISVQLM